MNEDAEGTLQTLRRLRTEIFRPLIAARRGRIVKNLGDGWIVTFETVTDAVQCAMQVQDRLKTDGALQTRTGIHIGDVMQQDEDVFGEGVNIAARLQQLADPGAVAISDPVYTLIDGTLRPSFDDFGKRKLKNIPRPLRVWARGGEVAGRAEELKASGFPRVVIRPVETSADGPATRDLANALTGDIADHLNALRIASARVATEVRLNEFELTSLLRVQGKRIRLESRLTRPDRGEIEKFTNDGDLADAFDWQDKASLSLASSVLNALIRVSAGDAEAVPESERSAELWVMLSYACHNADRKSFQYALTCLSRATELEPDSGFMHAQALTQLSSAMSLGFGPDLAEFAGKLTEWAEKVDELEPRHSPARIMLAFGRLYEHGEPSLDRSELLAIVRHMPFDPELLVWMGWIYLYVGEPEPALEYLIRSRKGVVPSVFQSVALAGLGFARIQQGKFEEALSDLEQSHRLSPGYPAPLLFLVAVYGQLGRPEKAKTYLEKYDRLLPGWSIAYERDEVGLLPTDAMQFYFDGLRKGGLPETVD
jgi:adenylate cyclase